MTELLGKQYRVIYADPPWAYRQGGRGAAKNHYHTMTTADICKMPVRKIAGGGGGCSLPLGNIPKHPGGHKGHGGVGLPV